MTARQRDRARRRTTEPTDGFAPCRWCGYCHSLEAWAATNWHAEHDASLGLTTEDLYTEER